MQVFTLASGSTGNCALVRDGSAAVLIDAGISAKRITQALSALGITPSQLSGILITHEHSDHIGGLATLTKNYEIPIFAPRTVANHLRWSVAGVDAYISELKPGQESTVGGFAVLPFHTPHDTPESVGYRVTGSGVLGYCTDFGHVTDEILEGLSGAKTVVIEANHDLELLKNGPYPIYLKRRILSDNGHLSNDDCGGLAAELIRRGTKKLVLAHLSRENNRPELAHRCVSESLRVLGIDALSDIQLEIAPEKETLGLTIEERLPC